MFSYIIELTMIFLWNRAIMFIDSVPQGEAMHHGEEKTELQIRRPRFSFLIFFVHIFGHIIQSLDLLHLIQRRSVCMGKCPPHDTGPKELPKRIPKSLPEMWKPATCQTRSDSSHQKRLRLSHKPQTRMWILSENRAFKGTYWTAKCWEEINC